MALYPIWIHDRKNPKPDADTFYELSANGFFLHKKTLFWNAVVPVDKISILEDQEPKFEFLLPPVPKDLVLAMIRFFAWYTKKHSSESLVLLWRYNDLYSLSVPKQDVSAGHVDYDLRESSPGLGAVLIGTFHSHGYGSAYHSPIDHQDEQNFDGIHGTFGSFTADNKNCFSLSLEACINNKRFVLEPDKFLEGISPNKKAVESKIKENEKEESSYWKRWINLEDQKMYRLSEPGMLVLPPDYKPNPEWKKNVIVKTLIQELTMTRGVKK